MQPMDNQRPWWTDQKPKPSRISLSTAIIMSIVAGIIGGALGNSSNISSLVHHQVKLVTASSTIERKADSVAGIAQRVLPSVVSISTESVNGSGSGSGFIIDSAGYILTNNHVVDAAIASSGTIKVTLNDGTTFDAKIVGHEPAYDLAVIKIAATNLSALQFGDSDAIQVGDPVIAVGSPLGLSGTVTSGIISAKNRAVTAGGSAGESSFINALQTDAAINPGNSGGPLVDATGAVIGINSAIASMSPTAGSQSGSIGLGFAIPINQARKTADQLIKTGKATYPIMGISIDSQFTGVGAKIANVPNAIRAGGPAAQAGLKMGDVITVFEGQKIKSSEELIVAVRAKNVGDKVRITYLRGKISADAELVLVAAP